MTVKTILVPLDFSETSARVLDFARALADAWGASLHLMHVIGYPVAPTERLETNGATRACAWRRS